MDRKPTFAEFPLRVRGRHSLNDENGWKADLSRDQLPAENLRMPAHRLSQELFCFKQQRQDLGLFVRRDVSHDFAPAVNDVGLAARKHGKVKRITVINRRGRIVELRDFSSAREATAKAPFFAYIGAASDFGCDGLQRLFHTLVIDPSIEVLFPAYMNTGVAGRDQQPCDSGKQKAKVHRC